MINTEDKNNTLEISDLEPFFLYYFGERIPENLTPPFDTSFTTSEDQLKLLSELESADEIKKFLENHFMEFTSFRRRTKLLTLPESLNTDIKSLKVSSEFDQYTKMTKEVLEKKRGDLRKFVKVKWLYNLIGKKYITFGIPNLEEIPNEVYQIGIQSSSSKDYFKYVSTSDARKVGIRFMIWTQYEKTDDRRIEQIVHFFNEFAKFERDTSKHIKAFTFYFDEFGTKCMKLWLHNHLPIEVRESNMHHSLSFDFNQVIKELKNAIQ